MEMELNRLEQKVSRAIEQCERLRRDNQSLRQELALRGDDITRLNDKLTEACRRLEALMEKLPE